MRLMNPDLYSENVPDWLYMYIQRLEEVAEKCDKRDYFPEEIEAVEKVVTDVEGGCDNEPSLTDRIITYLKTGRHTKDHPIPMGELAARIGVPDLLEMQEALESLHYKGKVDCHPTTNARDDLVYLIEPKEGT